MTAARILAQLVESPATGLVHVGGRERVSRYELMRRSAAVCGIDPSLVRPNLRDDVPSTEPRPADVSLETSRLQDLLPDLERPGIEDGLLQCRGNAPPAPRARVKRDIHRLDS